MDSHGNRDDTANFFQRLHTLRKTTKNTSKARNDGIDALGFIQDDLEFHSALSRPGARIMDPRRLKVYFSSLYPREWVLGQDADGNVSTPAYGAVSNSCKDRQSIPVAPLALVLLWKAVRLLASYCGAYEVHVACTLVGLFLGVNNQALSDVFFAVCAFVRAPFATLRLIFDIEMDFQRRLREEATFMRSLRHQSNTSTGWTRKSSLHIRLCIFAVVEYTALHYAGSKMGFGLCCLYFAWFTILSVVVV